ncbi:MAG TPA: type III pantothenate kinase [Tenuifilaceae bacterium]|nr:type III pantothenate kinase [Tenuifilaceae bacterium]HPE17628.1 type III pantothenate kinase [Tenuifilaceae bacterium]HPJ44969.1 type III pantothenate kinase [Tenuifilaceae bacterium]HPQ33784.1 type III pantothenate kinase [Tenuifilaceae bacterium]HRX67676.1 type III pantothenate kinase [Tenuifilaceae bacterium]
MNLIIDIGNTLTKLALVDNEDIVLIERYDNFNWATVEEIVDRYNVKKSIVSVVGVCNDEILKKLRNKIPVLFFNPHTPVPIKNCYTTPHSLGVDRLAAAVGVSHLYPSVNALCVDCGTAITYDFITSKGEYMGGAISPGITLRFKSLAHFTSKLPEVPFNEEYKLIGDSTVDSILAGVLNGVVNEVDGYISALKHQHPDLVVVFTGGDSIFFEKKLKNSIFVHPNIVILGLNRILNYNA